MIISEQGWIKVQEKTFAKWYAIPERRERSQALTNAISIRLNAKVKPRNVAVQDLVTDLSDGVNRPLSQ